MNKSPSLVAIIGGTGLIGWHAANALRRRGHAVRVLARSPPNTQLGFSVDEFQPLNYITATHTELVQALTDCTTLVHAAGPDPRVVPKGSARAYFFAVNVDATQRLMDAAVEAGVKTVILLTSYFHALRPQMVDHPYVASRLASEEAALSMDKAGKLRIVILQPPYVFGAIPGRTSLGDSIYAATRIPLLMPNGGTNAVCVAALAQAICGAVERDVHGRFLIGDENLSWVDLFKRFGGHAWTLPTPILMAVMIVAKLALFLLRRQSGLDPVALVKTIASTMYLDPTSSQEALGYSGGGLDDAILDITHGVFRDNPQSL